MSNLKPVNSILLRAPNWLGDCIMALPSIAALRRAYPQAALTVVRWKPGRLVTPADLLERGVPRSTFQNWLANGVLGRTGQRGKYRVTKTTEARIAAVQASQ